MDPIERRWWRMLDDLPGKLGEVHCWSGGRVVAPFPDSGEFHATPTSVVCLAGVVRVSRGHEHLDLQPGDGLIIGAGIWHVHEPLRPGSMFFRQGFLPTWSDVMLGDHERQWWGKLPNQPSRQLIELAMAAANARRRRTIFAELIAQTLSESISDFTLSQPSLQRMVDRLWSAVHLGVTVDDLVRVSGLSRAQAYRVFTAGYGLSPKEAIARTRLWLVEGLIAGGLKPSEAARQSGYPSLVTFRRAWAAARRNEA